MKKGKIIFVSIVIFICVFWLFFLFWDDKDVCLDSGWCKEGMDVNTENGCIIVNEKTCIENNGVWKSNKKVCHFKSVKYVHD